ncbi:hypothetical protein PDIG_42390 [Penicillium digitatum PHI26]|uniref:Uncharacterized protein n=2 Tax=Penicillium digitatum TaxID=36651 RepID=K9GCQ9_PEND2|nr:hypothetical protein PDIP_40970 [Penicillium digitatum Pd1]EKV12638.1 hypothetical protein PDIG_42390 [Penicillium digitatum PHI26]EKV15216.1 hypothetical protein PDIP_40970 [Penicillium digitatum Pd1]
MEPNTSENEDKTSKLDEGQIWVKPCHAATRKLIALLLSRSNQRKLHITIAELDLSSSETPEYGPRFVEPFPRDQLREYIVRERPWDGFDICGPNIDDTPKLRRYRRNELGSVYAPQWQWKLISWTTTKDKAQPHINAFVVDSQPHRVGRLNSGEVSLAYGLIAKRRIEDESNDHRYIPITVISASDFPTPYPSDLAR